MSKEPYEGEWSFDGSCAPPEHGGMATQTSFETFTLGCFQWVKRESGKGLKKGKVQYRVKGVTASPKEAYEKARAYCKRKNLINGSVTE